MREHWGDIENEAHGHREEPDPYPGWRRDLPDVDYDAMWEARGTLGGAWCEKCGRRSRVVEESGEEQIIPDRRISGPPSFRTYHVIRLACGHEIAGTP